MKIQKKIHLVFSCALVFFMPLLSSIAGVKGNDEVSLGETRNWTGKNGKQLRGQFVSRSGDTIEIISTKGKIFKIPLTSLAKSDREWLERALLKKQEKNSTFKGQVKAGDVIRCKGLTLPKTAPVGFKYVPDDSVVRADLPHLKPSDYYDKKHNSFENALTPFFLWWHYKKIIHVPSRRDDNKRRIKFLYKELNKAEVWVNRDLNTRSLKKFLNEELKTKASLQFLNLHEPPPTKNNQQKIDNLSPAFMSPYVKGANATVLSVKVTGKGSDYTAHLPLISCTPGGVMVMYMYDLKLHCSMKKAPRGKRDYRDTVRYTIKITNMADLPDWFQAREYEFSLSNRQGSHGLAVLVPQVPE